MSETYIIREDEGPAIDIAERTGILPSKYADPTEGERHHLTIREAREVAYDDPSLVYISLSPEDVRKKGDAIRIALPEETEEMSEYGESRTLLAVKRPGGERLYLYKKWERYWIEEG